MVGLIVICQCALYSFFDGLGCQMTQMTPMYSSFEFLNRPTALQAGPS